MRELRHNDVFDHVLSGEQSVAFVSEEILRLADDRRTPSVPSLPLGARRASARHPCPSDVARGE